MERIIIWDGSVSTSSRKRKRSKLPPLRKKKKIMLLITELPVMMMTAMSTDQKRMPQADIQSCLNQKTSWPCQEGILAESTARVSTS